MSPLPGTRPWPVTGLLALGALLVLAPACAKKTPPPEPPKPSQPEWDTSPPGAFKREAAAPAAASDDLRVRGTHGTLDEADVQNTVREHWDEVNRCYLDGLRTLPQLGGQLKLKFKVARDGSVKLAVITESNLGVYSVERCVLEVARRLRFPRPEGGEADVIYPLSFPSRRPVQEYSTDLIARDLRGVHKTVRECRKTARKARSAVPRTFTLTLYLAPGGWKRGKRVGKARFVGYASPEESVQDEFASCMVESFRNWTFTTPPAPLAKVVVAWPLRR